MLNIGIIGANGQVGSEVCLFLSHMEGVRVIPICRSRYGAAFLRRCGLESRIGSVDESPEAAKTLLADCHLVADFSLPKGMAFEMKAATRGIVGGAIAHAPPGAPFVYASSYMAFGMHPDHLVMRRHLFNHGTYGAMKRDGERLAFQEGARAGRDIYVLRLGQVHGEIQGLSCRAISGLKDRVATLPETAHDIVFAFSIAEALRNIAQGKERPGLYTLLSEPAWSWTDLYAYYAHRAGIVPRLETQPDAAIPTLRQRVQAFLRRFTTAPFMSFARFHREWLTSSVLIHFPRIESRLKAVYSIGNARRDIAELCDAERYRPFSAPVGRVPGDRLRSLSDSRQTLEPAAQAVRRQIEHVLDPR